MTCLSEMTLLGIAQEKFYNQTAVFTNSLANLGKTITTINSYQVLAPFGMIMFIYYIKWSAPIVINNDNFTCV